MSEVTDFGELLQEVQDLAQQTLEDIVEAANRIVDMLNGAAGSFAQFLDDILPGENELEHAIDKWNNEIQPAIQQGVDELLGNVSDAVDRLAGNPVRLIDYANAYADAKRLLYSARSSTIEQDLYLLGRSWEGDGFEAFSVVATHQDAALLDLAHSLEQGGANTIAAAHKILELWRQLLREFTGYQSEIIRLLASATDASKVLSFEVPTILEAIAMVWDGINDIADILLEFMTAQATTDAYSWRTLVNGSDGLPENTWPPVAPGVRDDISDPGKWTVPA